MADKEMYSLANSYPEMQGNPMDVKDHPDTMLQANAFMTKLTRRGGPGPLLNDWSGSFGKSEK
mgnify:CR=1 FL=1